MVDSSSPSEPRWTRTRSPASDISSRSRRTVISETASSAAISFTDAEPRSSTRRLMLSRRSALIIVWHRPAQHEQVQPIIANFESLRQQIRLRHMLLQPAKRRQQKAGAPMRRPSPLYAARNHFQAGICRIRMPSCSYTPSSPLPTISKPSSSRASPRASQSAHLALRGLGIRQGIRNLDELHRPSIQRIHFLEKSI